MASRKSSSHFYKKCVFVQTLYVTGRTSSTDFPTTSGAYDTSFNGDSDVFVSKLDGNLSAGTASNIQPVTLASNLAYPNFITIDQDNVYWTENKYSYYNSTLVKKVPLNGGTVTTVATQGNTGRGGEGGTGIAVDNNSVYWGINPGYGSGDIYKIPKSGGSIVNLASANQPHDIDVDSTDVYWAEYNTGGEVRKVPINGGTVTRLTTIGTGSGIMTMDSAYVYFKYWYNDFTKIAKISKNGGSIIDLVSIPFSYPWTSNNPIAIAVDSDNVYWVETSSSSVVSGRVNKVSINGGAITTLATGLNNPQRVVVDSSSIYWTESADRKAGTGAIKKISIFGGDVITLASGLNNPFDIAIDDSYIYWTEKGTNGSDGSIKKLATTAQPPTVTTGDASDITLNAATLNGVVNANGLDASAWFEYGTTSGGPYLNSNTQTVTGSSDTPVSIGISGLSAGTKYYYRLVAENSAGKSEGGEKSFETGILKVNHVVIIDIDGLRPDILRISLGKGQLPNLQKLFGGDQLGTNTASSIWVKNCRTNFPSVTFSGQATIFTGCYINNHGIFGNGWFDRQKDEGEGEVKDYMDWRILFQWSNKQNQDLQRKTIYEEAAENGLKSLVMWNQFVGKHLNNIVWNTPSLQQQREYITDPDYYDQMMIDDAIKALDGKEAPSIVTLYFASLDHTSHCMTETPFEVLPKIDTDLGKFLDALKQNLNDADLKDVIFVLVSDHGHTLVAADTTHQITDNEIWKALKSLKYKVYMPPKEDEERSLAEERKAIEQANLVMCTNDGMEHFYVKNGRSKKWDSPPDFCKDIIPLAHKLRYTQKKISKKEELPYIMKKENKGTKSEDEMILVKKRETGKYMVYTGKGAKPLCDEVKDLDVYFNLSEEDAIKRLYSEGSGDVLILTNFDDGYDLYNPQKWYNLFGYCCEKKEHCDELMGSDHGSILDSDRLITFVICGTPIAGRVIDEDTNQVDVAPTIAGILGFTMPEADGKNIMESQ